VHVGAAARETSLPVQDGPRRGHGDADQVALWRNLAASRARSHRMAHHLAPPFGGASARG